MFRMKDNGNLTFSIANIILDGQKSIYPVTCSYDLRAVYVGIGCTFTMEDGATIRNSVAANYNQVRGGGVYLQNAAGVTTTFRMRPGSEITGCEAYEGGGIWVWGTNSSANPVVEIDGAKITNCTSTDCGAAMSGQGIKITGDSEISGNTAKNMSAISLNSWGTISISGNTKITGNTTSGSDSAAIGVKSNAQASSRINVSGSVTIYDNLNSSGAQANLIDNSSADSGSRIYVTDDGLASTAKIGVYSQNNVSEGSTFGRTNASSSVAISDLSVFKNDKNTDLISLAGDDNRIVWSNLEPVMLRAKLSEAQIDDTWITFEITQKNSGATYRQSVKVDALETTGEATVMLYAGRTYEIKQSSSASSWRFTASSISYTNAKSDSGTDDWSLTSEDVGATLEIFNPTNAAQSRVITVESNYTNDLWQSFCASVINALS